MLVLTPTRELAIQVAEAMQTYARHLKGFHVLPIYGGQGMDFQLQQLRRGVHVVVGTPGRIQDHLRRKTLKLDRLKAVVLDEADEMLRMGFIEDVEDDPAADAGARSRWRCSPRRCRIGSARSCSTTCPSPSRSRSRRRRPRSRRSTSAIVEVRGFDKLEALTRILEAEDFDAMLIFVRTRHGDGRTQPRSSKRAASRARR